MVVVEEVLRSCGHRPLAEKPEQKSSPNRVLEPEEKIDGPEGDEGDEEARPSAIGQARRRPANQQVRHPTKHYAQDQRAS